MGLEVAVSESNNHERHTFSERIAFNKKMTQGRKKILYIKKKVKNKES